MGKQETVEDLRARAPQYGITNADQMNDAQLRSEIKAIEDQPKTAETADEGVPSDQQPAPAQNTAGAQPQASATGNKKSSGSRSSSSRKSSSRKSSGSKPSSKQPTGDTSKPSSPGANPEETTPPQE